MTAWKESRAVLPMISSSSCAEPTPGTCTRMRSEPWRWIEGSRVPASSTRRRMISRLCCIVRWSSAAFWAAVSVTTSWSPSALTSNSREPAPMIEMTGCARSCAALTAAVHAGGVADADAQLLGVALEAADGADLVAQVAELVAEAGPEALELLGVDGLGLDLDQHVRAAAEVEAEVDEPRRQEGGPAAHRRLELGGERRAALDRLAGVVGLLDPGIEEVRQHDEEAEQADADDEQALPGGVVGHVSE